MQNFTGSWARAASQPMPGAVNPMMQSGVGPGPTVGSLRPKPNPQAGLNEKPTEGWSNSALGMLINQMLGKSAPKQNPVFGQSWLRTQMQKPSAPANAPAAGLAEDRADRMDRASKLMSIGAGLMG